MKRVLITGKNSFVGTSLKKRLDEFPDRYLVDLITLRDNSWMEMDFSKYDVVCHVAALVHKKEKPDMESHYYKVNRDLSLDIARKAKKSGVIQFIFMSTMAVYGEEGRIGEEVVINNNTMPNPKTYYGKSKLEAEILISKIKNNKFKVSIVRPPMIYGPNCPGNYKLLEIVAQKVRVFPYIDNERSVIHIDKLCTDLKKIIDEEAAGVFLTQDVNYINTSSLVKKIAEENGKKIILSRVMGKTIVLFGKKLKLINKVFGNLVYDQSN